MGKTIAFPKDVAQRKTALTFGEDVAVMLICFVQCGILTERECSDSAAVCGRLEYKSCN